MYNNFDNGTGSQMQKKCALRKNGRYNIKILCFSENKYFDYILMYWSKFCLNQSLYNISNKKNYKIYICKPESLKVS